MDKVHSSDENTSAKGRNIVPFLACTGIASLLWVFTTLNGSFEGMVDVHLDYDLPPGKINSNELPSEATLFVETTGWQLLREQFNRRHLTIDLPFLQSGKPFVTNAHVSSFVAEMPSDIHVLRIYPDTIHLHMEDLVSKKIPIRFNYPSDTHQFYTDSLYYFPDSVTVFGPASKIEQYTQWQTDPASTYIDSLIIGTVALIKPADQQISLSHVAVQYHIRQIEPVRAILRGTVYCPVTATRDSVYASVAFSKNRQTPLDFEGLGLECFHEGNAHTYRPGSTLHNVYNISIYSTLYNIQW